jgi:hypothetical protein
LWQLLDGASERGRVALISGEAGIGKSRLLKEMMTGARASGWRVLTARFFEQDTDVPYSAVSQLLSAAVASSPEEAKRFLAPFAADLRLIAPEVGELAGAAATSGAPQELDPEDRRRSLTSRRSVSAAAWPTLLAFEDALGRLSSQEALFRLRAMRPGCLILSLPATISPALDR